MKQWDAKGERLPYYVVQPGDTLYSIGQRYGIDYHRLARWNEIRPPYRIYAGQKLWLVPPSRQAAEHLDITAASQLARGANLSAGETTLSSVHGVRAVEGILWRWPTQGKVTQTFTATKPGHKGIEIAGQLGQPIVAAADGEVVYSGMGLPRYGKLIIVKHNDSYLSVYAYNSVLISQEGEAVEGGQKIAEMGRTGAARRAKLHFEIRYNGDPVNPLHYLPKQ